MDPISRQTREAEQKVKILYETTRFVSSFLYVQHILDAMNFPPFSGHTVKRNAKSVFHGPHRGYQQNIYKDICQKFAIALITDFGIASHFIVC
jgi:hypothetical protein